jgi:hypothetical protein
MSNVGHKAILKCLHDNTTLLKLNTRLLTAGNNPDGDGDGDNILLRLEGGIEGRLSQNQIDCHYEVKSIFEKI